MRTESRGILSALESYIDMAVNLFAILMAYMFVLMIYEPKIALNSPWTIVIIFFNLVFSSFAYHAMGLYKQNRYAKPYHSLPLVLKSNLVYFGIMAIITAFITRAEYKEFVLFWLLFSATLSTSFLTFKRHLIKVLLRTLRSKQFQVRKVIIIGDNTAMAKEYLKEINLNSQFGFMVLGYIGDKISHDVGVEKLGSFKDTERVLDKYKPNNVIFAIDSCEKRNLIKLVNMCDDRCIKVYFMPVIYGYFKNSRQIEQIGNIPLINIHSTPLDNIANVFFKRLIDLVGATLLIILTSPIMLFAAIGVRISSPGPVLFKQERVGVLGKKFTMLKFRSMRIDTKNDGWTIDEDPRKTKFGNFIRKTSIDELPQLFNVLVGSMSLVGPRPEIPVFVNHFKEIIPLYMVKHYVKPGMTGLAQIKGLRGDTSVEDRILVDIAYIENWSLMLDIYILLKTPFKAINKHEKYVKVEGEVKESESSEASEGGVESENEKSEPADIEQNAHSGLLDLEESLGIHIQKEETDEKKENDDGEKET